MTLMSFFEGERDRERGERDRDLLPMLLSVPGIRRYSLPQRLAKVVYETFIHSFLSGYYPSAEHRHLPVIAI